MSESWKLTLPCTRAEAEALHDDIPALAEMDPAPSLVTNELEPFNDAKWELQAYFDGKPDTASVKLIQSLIPGAVGAKPILERLPDEDWLTLSQQGLEPVLSGRFFVHTSTFTSDPPRGTKAYLIEASQAFGTGGHETTSGCLAMLDRLKRAGSCYEHIVDIGTGTGLLAFAANHLWPRAYVTASDIDPVSIDVSMNNAKVNGVALGQKPGRVALCVAMGTEHEMIQRRAPYDLLIANILAGPLIELARSFAAIMADGGTLILAGLLDTQSDIVARAYRAQGFRLAERCDTGDWPCLRFVKRHRFGMRRPVRWISGTSQPPGDFGTW